MDDMDDMDDTEDTEDIDAFNWDAKQRVPPPEQLDRPCNSITVQQNSSGKMIFYDEGSDYIQINGEAVCDIDEWA